MNALLIVAGLGAALSSGVLFAFSSFVMAGLGRIEPSAGIAAMQSINVTVVNPLFMGVYLGTGALSIALTVMMFAGFAPATNYRLLAGATIYLLGVLGITLAFNVPMNDALAAVNPASREGHDYWLGYLSDWTMWNHIRCVAGLIAAALFVTA